MVKTKIKNSASCLVYCCTATRVSIALQNLQWQQLHVVVITQWLADHNLFLPFTKLEFLNYRFKIALGVNK